MWNDVLVFTNVFLQATRTVCANYSQGNQVLFGENTGKQCVTMSLTAVIYHHLEDINFWTSSTLNNVLTIGNNLYMCISIRCSVQTNDYLLLKCHCDEISHFFFPLFFTQNNLPSFTMSFRPERKN